jgi:[ribosomal protein S18]-alanine N-acetyltransferase
MTRTSLRVEPATIASKDLLAALHSEIFTSEEQVWNAGSFAELMAMPGMRAWLAIDTRDDEDLPVGLALSRFTRDEGEIITIGVVPTARRSGVAAALLGEITDHADRSDAGLFLEVAADNNAALQLYLVHGFTEVGRRKSYYKRQNSDRVDALVLKRNPSGN